MPAALAQGGILDSEDEGDSSPTFESRSIMTPHGTARNPLFGTSILDSRNSELRGQQVNIALHDAPHRVLRSNVEVAA